MNSINPHVSVVIPTLNEEKYLKRCLESLKNQTFKDFEIIVSDGGSKDSTQKIARQYHARVISHPNSTITLARQLGTMEGKGSIIVGADADTAYPPDHLQKIINDFQKDNKYVVVGGGGVFERNPWWIYAWWKCMYYVLGHLFTLFGWVLYIPAFNLSFKKAAFLKIGGYRTYIDFGGDEMDILERLKKIGKAYFDIHLNPYPSSRRARVGFLQLLIKHSIIDYYLGYVLSKIFRRPIIKGQPVR